MTAESPFVLLLADAFSLRGTSAYTLRLAEQLPALGFRTQIVCPCARMVKVDRREELPIEEYPYLKKDWRNLFDKHHVTHVIGHKPEMKITKWQYDFSKLVFLYEDDNYIAYSVK